MWRFDMILFIKVVELYVKNSIFYAMTCSDDGLQPRWPKLSGQLKVFGFTKTNVYNLQNCSFQKTLIQ